MSKISLIVKSCFNMDNSIFKLDTELKKMGKSVTSKYFSGNYYRGNLNESKLSVDVFRNVLTHLDKFDYDIIRRVMNFSHSAFINIPADFIDKYKTDAMKFCGVCQEFTDFGYIKFLDYKNINEVKGNVELYMSEICEKYGICEETLYGFYTGESLLNNTYFSNDIEYKMLTNKI